MKNDLFFYFMKVGAGNAFMDFTEQLGELEDRKGLFVGYYGRQIPAITDEGEFLGTLEDKELQTIARASRDALQARSIACVFTDSDLTFWEITGYLGAMPEKELQRFAEIPSQELNQALDYDKDWKDAKRAAPGGQINAATYFQGYHWLPVRLLHKVPRHRLLAPVDSLRVHRWLNSGTFRSLHSIKGNGLMEDIVWLKKIKPLDPGDICSRTRETSYAKLVRQYLTGLFPSSDRINLDEGHLAELASLWINPAQLETVGALLALDLGFTLEVGLGKGQDVVDIKASLGHLKGAKKKTAIQSVLDRLEKVLKVGMTPAFRKRITNEGIFWVQCKARDLDEKLSKRTQTRGSGEDPSLRGKGPNPDLVLTLMPGTGKDAKKGQLYLSHLMKCVAAQPKDFRHLSNWRHVYIDQIRQGMCGPRS